MQAEQQAERVPDGGIVIDVVHGVFVRHGIQFLSSIAPCAGSTIFSTAWRLGSTVSEPPCVSTIDLLIARPRPRPLAFMEMKGSNSRARICSAIPGPLSAILIHTEPA